MKTFLKAILRALHIFEPVREVKIAFALAQRQLADYARHLRGCRKARRLVAGGALLRLELGAGAVRHAGWVSVDLFDAGADLPLDLRRPLPFPDQSIDEIHSEHVLEHLAFPGELDVLLRESFRVLKPGGIFSAGVPDFARAVRLYVQGDAARFAAGKFWASPTPNWCADPMDELCHLMYTDGQHRCMFSPDTLQHRLREAGFPRVALREFDPTLDAEHRRQQTIYVRGVK